MPQTDCTQAHVAGEQWDRARIADALAQFRSAQSTMAASQRDFAESSGIPRTTLQHWLGRRESLLLDEEQGAFFESPAGAAFLLRLVVSAHFAMTWTGTCGIRLVGQFLRLCGLEKYVACSYGTHQKLSSRIAEALVTFGKEERSRLGATMVPRDVTVCEDETFLSEGICLVAIEPVSGFILAERYAEKRDAETWNQELGRATDGLPVTVVQSTADEAKALAAHARDIGAHHSPDLFHVQNEVNRATVLPLLRRSEGALKVHESTKAAVQRGVEARDAYQVGPRGPGRPPNFEARIQEAQVRLDDAAAALSTAQQHRLDSLAAVRAIADDYHPFDLSSGAKRTPEQLDECLRKHLGVVRTVATEAALSIRSNKGIEKAARVAPKMVATLRFFHDRVEQQLQALGLSEPLEQAMRAAVIPAAYLLRAAGRTDQIERRDQLRALAGRLVAPHQHPDSPIGALAAGDRECLEAAAFELADLFQRASSCVEGRNGRLSQWEHAQRKLTPKKLDGLTVVQNYFAQRQDKTTAAERFFGTRPRDIFMWLLDQMPAPSRPKRARTRPAKTMLLQPA